MDAQHVPVLLEETLGFLAPERGGLFVDATLGLGGHSEAVLDRCPEAHLVGVDRDPHALELAGARLAPFEGRTTLVHAVYDEIPEVLAELGIDSVDGILFDLGVSSLQLDAEERGFSYSRDADLDMRMDPRRGRTAADVLNTYPVPELARVLREYGEERFAGRIAGAVGRRRDERPFQRSGDLVELLYATVPAASRRTGGHPAKRTFQALRIEVNGELAAWTAALPAALDALRVGGRIVVLAYHSLEDRITKRELAERSTSSTPVGLPVELPGHGPSFRLLVRGAEQADDGEVAENPRAASLRLRAAERIGEGENGMAGGTT